MAAETCTPGPPSRRGNAVLLALVVLLLQATACPGRRSGGWSPAPGLDSSLIDRG